MKTFKRILYLLFLSLFVFTHAYAEKDLNSVMHGTYAFNETWFCFNPFNPAPPISLNVSGIISFDGNGNAEDRGSFGTSGPPDPMNPMVININTHTGQWQYQVFDNPEDCKSEGDASDEEVICDFKYLGTRTLSDIDGDGNPETEDDLVFYGKIGGNGFTGNGKTTDVILIERHDGAFEIINRGAQPPIDELPLGVCDKAGTLVKISNFPQDLVEEGDGFPAENQVGGFPAENQVGGFPAK